MLLRRIAISLIATLVISVAYAQEHSILANGRDTISYRYTPITQPQAKQSGWSKVYNYFQQSSTDKTATKKFDVSVVGAPTYSSTTGLGLGVMASGLYRVDRTNLQVPPSTVSLFARATLKGIYNVGIEGINIFKDNRDRIAYRVAFVSQPTMFWGVGYDAAISNTPIKYTSNSEQVELSYYHRLYRNLYIGTKLNFDYIYTRKRDRELIAPLIGGGKNESLTTGLSLLLEYDSRDFIPNPYRGVYISVQGMIRPKALSNIQTNSWRITGTASYYQRLWKGGLLAMDLYVESNSSGTPWQLYARMGSKYRMRGYYEGRFTDRNMVTAQAELRQRVWRRIGVAVWGGAGNCFSSWDNYQWSHTLPNYGVGVRWEFKKRVNVRFDYGFGGRVNGRLINGFQVLLNEAF